MTRLEELVYALATVIVRYHDIQDNIATKDKFVTALDPTMRKKKSHDRAVEIIQDTKTDFAPYLEGKINACTGGYQARKEFLSFILSAICYLKEQNERKIPFEPKELQAFHEQLTQLFIDFRQLLNVYKGSKYPVTLINSKSAKTQEFNGLLNDRLVGGKYCNSGLLLIDEVFFVLHMTTEDSNVELKEIATNICLEQQTLLENQCEKLKKVDEREQNAQKLEQEKQKAELEAQKLEQEKLKAELEAQKLEQEKQKAELEAQKLEQEKQKAELEAQKLLWGKEKGESDSQILELKEKNKALLATIEESSKELEKTKSELQKAKDTPARRFPVYTPFYGSLAALNMLPGTNPRFFQQQSTSSQSLPQVDDIDESIKKAMIE
ncbi:DUF874 family protein [Legionella parisiensis]|uniref:Uncharacterized protein n=1 Tax=Legionella parisiensis TaxID=45071 RepID=A0A1E5JPE5_9GAMM|nr:DUF874 family protein [Legionella parisiensis]KTD42026.1 hypothetical protein Lpar_3343 [Legionella parisiensis]OEH46392.1 hypothetical protein lpari_02731 [Legionella parisiensis]STX75495.1 Uncharacterised protein [Legionella parisiensis]